MVESQAYNHENPGLNPGHGEYRLPQNKNKSHCRPSVDTATLVVFYPKP